MQTLSQEGKETALKDTEASFILKEEQSLGQDSQNALHSNEAL